MEGYLTSAVYSTCSELKAEDARKFMLENNYFTSSVFVGAFVDLPAIIDYHRSQLNYNDKSKNRVPAYLHILDSTSP